MGMLMRRTATLLPLALSAATLLAPPAWAQTPDAHIAKRLTELENDRRKIAYKEIWLIAVAVESYAVDHNAYPTPAPEFVPTPRLAEKLKPYLPTVPARDPWGSTYLYVSSGQSYVIVSDFSYAALAKEGFATLQKTVCTGAAEGVGADLVFSDGMICRWVGEKPTDPWK
jgi:hypothetical protein